MRGRRGEQLADRGVCDPRRRKVTGVEGAAEAFNELLEERAAAAKRMGSNGLGLGSTRSEGRPRRRYDTLTCRESSPITFSSLGLRRI